MTFNLAHADVPGRQTTDDFVLRPITAADTERDYAAVMESRDFLRLWEQSSWPADDFTVEDNRADVEMLEQRHVKGDAFTYTVTDVSGVECLGCVYVMATTAGMYTGARFRSLTERRWTDYEAAVYYWVRKNRLGTAVDRALLDFLRTWFAGEWALDGHLFVTNKEFTQQYDLFEATDLQRRFTFRERDKGSPFVAYS